MIWIPIAAVFLFLAVTLLAVGLLDRRDERSDACDCCYCHHETFGD